MRNGASGPATAPSSPSRTYALTTVRMEELMPNDTQGASWTGVALAGPTPKFAAGANQASLRLMRVR